MIGGGTMASAEHEPIMGVWGRAPSGVQGQSPWYVRGSGGRSPPEAVVSVMDSGAVGPGFKSQPRRGRVTVLGKPFTPIVPLFTKQRNW